jgi:hypothetical protein
VAQRDEALERQQQRGVARDGVKHGELGARRQRGGDELDDLVGAAC